MQGKRKRRMRLPNGYGSIHKIDGNRRRKPWRARVAAGAEVDYETGTAKAKYITIGYFETEAEALAALAEYHKSPFTLEAAEATFLDVVNAWELKKYPDASVSAQKAYNAAKKNCTPIHAIKMRDIRTEQLDNLMNSIEGGRSVQVRLKSYLGQIYKYAMERDIVQKNYADFVKVKTKDEGTKRTDIPAEDRAKLWQEANKGNTIAQIALIYIYTGFRATELLDMQKENVDLEARIMVGGLKTDAGRDRHVPIHKCILPFVETFMQTEGEHLLTQERKGKVTPYTYSSFFRTHWQPCMEQLGMLQYTPHYCRHTCATMMREANIEEDIRKLILGHSTQDITDRYTHINDSMLVEAIDKLPNQ